MRIRREQKNRIRNIQNLASPANLCTCLLDIFQEAVLDEPSTSHLMVAHTTHVNGSSLNSSPGAKQACNVKHINISISTTLCIFPPTCETGRTWYHQQLDPPSQPFGWTQRTSVAKGAAGSETFRSDYWLLGTCDAWKLDETETNMNHECIMYVYVYRWYMLWYAVMIWLWNRLARLQKHGRNCYHTLWSEENWY